ncbi:hypothetical protein Tco_0941525 [Tanacetum coccineum]|uniref:Retroviral polymerase SH3-like domain-containing protein n=1 Tax=Tanacetum coccineum TaxID=301880 RepID=A0ABQ5DR42_9ASTR
MAAAAMKDMASNFAKLDKFKGVDFRRWQKKMHFLVSSMSVVYMLTNPIPKDGENATMEQINFKHTLKHQKEELTLVELGSNLHIKESLKVQDNNKPKENNFAGPSVVNMVEYNNSTRKPRHLKKDCKGLKVGNKANRSCINGSVDGSTNSLKGATLHVFKDRCWFKTYKSLNDGSILHMGNESTTLVHGRGCVDLRFSSRKIVSLVVVRLPDPKLKTLGERGIECIFVGYTEHSKAFRFYVIEPNGSFSINSIIESRDAIFDKTRFSSVPTPSLKIYNGTKDNGGPVIPEEVTREEQRIRSLTSTPIALILKMTPTFDEAMKS